MLSKEVRLYGDFSYYCWFCVQPILGKPHEEWEHVNLLFVLTFIAYYINPTIPT